MGCLQTINDIIRHYNKSFHSKKNISEKNAKRVQKKNKATDFRENNWATNQ